MSSLIVPITEIDEVKPHPNADRLELAVIGGWQVIVGKGTYQSGDRVVYVPPDAVVPVEWSDAWGVTQYLSKQRVRSVKLRGEPSFGFTVSPSHLPPGDYSLGENVADLFGITKFEPPIRMAQADQRHEDARLSRYHDAENVRHFPDAFTDGQLVAVTEKVHGTQSRVALIEGEFMAGSKRTQRESPEGVDESGAVFETNKLSTYWYPLDVPGVREMLLAFGQDHQQVILYGEIYGPKIQSFDYGLKDGRLGYVAFDLMVDGRYLDFQEFKQACSKYGVPTAPLLYVGPYDADAVKQLTVGKSLLGGTHIREGVVIRTLEETRHPKLGRLSLKLVADDYLTGNVEDLQEAVA